MLQYTHTYIDRSILEAPKTLAFWGCSLQSLTVRQECCSIIQYCYDTLLEICPLPVWWTVLQPKFKTLMYTPLRSHTCYGCAWFVTIGTIVCCKYYSGLAASPNRLSLVITVRPVMWLASFVCIPLYISNHRTTYTEEQEPLLQEYNCTPREHTRGRAWYSESEPTVTIPKAWTFLLKPLGYGIPKKVRSATLRPFQNESSFK